MHGELDIATAPELVDLLARLRHHGHAVTVDLAEVTFMDSTGLRELLRATSDGHTVVLRNVPKQVRILLELAGVDSLFTID